MKEIIFMKLLLKDGRTIDVARMGRAEAEHGSDEIAGYDFDGPDKDLFGNPVLEIFHLSDVDRFLGVYAFPPKDYEKL